MRHEWIFDVLTDLLSYSQRNGLQGLAHQVEGALRVARAEVDAERRARSADDSPGGGGGPGMRPQ